MYPRTTGSVAATSNRVTATTRPGLVNRETYRIRSSDEDGNDCNDDDGDEYVDDGDAEKHQ